jgi:hypothetical protein
MKLIFSIFALAIFEFSVLAQTLPFDFAESEKTILDETKRRENTFTGIT